MHSAHKDVFMPERNFLGGISSTLFGYYNPYTTKTRDKKFCLGFKTIFKNGVIIFSFTVL